MRVGQRLRDLGDDFPGTFLAQRAARHLLLQRFPVQELEDEEGSVVPRAPVVRSHDVRMVQAGGGARLSIEELQLGVVQAAAALEQLDRHRTREHAVACFEHPGEAAPTDLAHQLETVGDGHSWGELAHQRGVRVDWSPGNLTKKGLEGRGLRYVPERHLSRDVYLLAATTRSDGRMR